MSKNATNVEVAEQSAAVRQMTPADFNNRPTGNSLGVDPEVLMTCLANKQSWSDPDPYGLTDPLACAGVCHIWSNMYLDFHGLL